jgi:hypothetical protein
VADPRYPIRCAAAPASAGMEGSVGLPCAAVRRLSAGRAWRRRHLETDFAQMSIGPPKGDSRPASAQRLQRDGAGGVNGSISLSSSPRAARQRPIWSHGTAPLTPRLGAPRPPSREHTPAHRSGGAATTPQCRPARVRPLKHLLLRPSNRRADLQPLRALPPRATSSALQTVPPASPPHTGLPCPWISFFATVKGLTSGGARGKVQPGC